MTLNVIQAQLSLHGVMGHLRRTNNMKVLRCADEGVLIKTAFAESMGSNPDPHGAPPWPKPFDVARRGKDGVLEVVGYSTLDADGIKAMMTGLPSLLLALPPKDIISSPLPKISVGWTERFSVKFCPMVTTHRKERDVCLIESDNAKRDGREPMLREQVYMKYLTDRMKGVEISNLQCSAFSLQHVIRDEEDACWKDPVAKKSFQCPIATLWGVVTVTDPDAFLDIISRGIGRRRTYGNGMIRLGALADRLPDEE